MKGEELSYIKKNIHVAIVAEDTTLNSIQRYI